MYTTKISVKTHYENLKSARILKTMRACLKLIIIIFIKFTNFFYQSYKFLSLEKCQIQKK